jgi:D-3-phosphoglycerate dehydrogenase
MAMTNTFTAASTGSLKTSIDKQRIRFLLLEGIHPSAVAVLEAAGYSHVESVPGALPEEELKARIADAHFLGIRSRTQLTAEVLG